MVNLIDLNNLPNTLMDCEIKDLGNSCYKIINKSQSIAIEVLDIEFATKTMQIRSQHTVYDIVFKDNIDLVLDQLGIKRNNDTKSTSIKAPMPGKVLQIVAKEGDQIEKGGAILILEAMKMENVLKAESDCTIKKVLINNDDSVEKNQILVELD